MGDTYMDQWIVFLQDKWMLVIVAIVVLFLVMKLVKTFVKWVIVIAVIAFGLYYGSNYAGKLGDLKTTLGNAVVGEAKQQLTNAIVGEGKNAAYKKNADGSFTVSTKNIKLEGKPGSDQAKVTFLGQSYNVSINKTIQKFIDEAKQNQ
jgi:hypothetical protein